MSTAVPAVLPRAAAKSRGSRRLPVQRVSGTFLLYSVLMLFMGLAAVNTQANLLFGVFGLMIGIMLVSWALSRVVLRKLEVRRETPELAVVGRPAVLRYEFTNRKRFWPSLSITLVEIGVDRQFVHPPATYLMHAGARSTVSVPAEVVPTRRGLVQFGRRRLSTGFPFGFVRRGSERDEHDTMVVLPPLASVDRKLISLCRSATRVGESVRPRRGGDDEFYGLKEYRGENPRRIYWKRSARTGTLVAREMTQVSPPRIVLMVDTCTAASDPAGLALVEQVVAMAASLASVAFDQGLPVGLCAWGGNEWIRINPLDGRIQRKEVLTAIAKLPRNATQTLDDLTTAGRELIAREATGVVLTPRPIDRTADLSRSRLISVGAGTTQADAWFRFPAETKFETLIPIEQLSSADA